MHLIKNSVYMIFPIIISLVIPYSEISKGSDIPVIVKKDNGENSFLVSQQQPDYVCNLRIEQNVVTPPDVVIRSTVFCVTGIPRKLTVKIYHSNVNRPNTLYLLSTKEHICSVNPCATPSYIQRINRTELLTGRASVDLTGIRGKYYQSRGKVISIRPYNNYGIMYPQIRPTRQDMKKIPFPPGPYVKCCVRGNTFRNDLESYYRSSGWSFPPSPYEAHHIKPIDWGGIDDYQFNGVLLGKSTHLLFSNWWNGFSNDNW